MTLEMSNVAKISASAILCTLLIITFLFLYKFKKHLLQRVSTASDSNFKHFFGF